MKVIKVAAISLDCELSHSPTPAEKRKYPSFLVVSHFRGETQRGVHHIMRCGKGEEKNKKKEKKSYVLGTVALHISSLYAMGNELSNASLAVGLSFGRGNSNNNSEFRVEIWNVIKVKRK